MAARALRLAYQLRTHRVSRWGLDQWLAGLALLAALWVVLRHPEALADGLLASWLQVAGLTAVGVATYALGRWAQKAGYVRFARDPAALPPIGLALDPGDKILVRASGEFAVGGKVSTFAGLLAYWRTFATREHAVMAIVQPSRFLLLGRVPEEDLGMWYVFFRPERLGDVSAGEIAFGGDTGPGLLVNYHDESRPKAIYLRFDSVRERQRVWGDLAADTRPI